MMTRELWVHGLGLTVLLLFLTLIPADARRLRLSQVVNEKVMRMPKNYMPRKDLMRADNPPQSSLFSDFLSLLPKPPPRKQPPRFERLSEIKPRSLSGESHRLSKSDGKKLPLRNASRKFSPRYPTPPSPPRPPPPPPPPPRSSGRRLISLHESSERFVFRKPPPLSSSETSKEVRRGPSKTKYCNKGVPKGNTKSHFVRTSQSSASHSSHNLRNFLKPDEHEFVHFLKENSNELIAHTLKNNTQSQKVEQHSFITPADVLKTPAFQVALPLETETSASVRPEKVDGQPLKFGGTRNFAPENNLHLSPFSEINTFRTDFSLEDSSSERFRFSEDSKSFPELEITEQDFLDNKPVNVADLENAIQNFVDESGNVKNFDNWMDWIAQEQQGPLRDFIESSRRINRQTKTGPKIDPKSDGIKIFGTDSVLGAFEVVMKAVENTSTGQKLYLVRTSPEKNEKERPSRSTNSEGDRSSYMSYDIEPVIEIDLRGLNRESANLFWSSYSDIRR